jgi:hypothetical protein
MHAVIIHDKNSEIATTTLIDSNSSNGIFINNNRVMGRGILHSGDLIIFTSSKKDSILEDLGKKLPEMQQNLISTLDEKSIVYKFEEIQDKKRSFECPVEIQDNKKVKLEDEKFSKQEVFILSRSDIEQEFLCPICQCLLYESTTLQPCCHTFCKKCILNWTKTQRTCPTCRKTMTKKPLKNLSIDNILDKICQKLSPEENKQRQEKIAVELKKENDGIQKLSQQVKKAQQSGQKFLKLDANWTPKEKTTFKQGIDQYPGKARAMFCGLTGLTEDWIKNANSNGLMRAITNLDISITMQTDRLEEMREALRDFVNGENYWNMIQ